MAFPDGTPEKTSRFTAVSALVMRKYSTKVLSAGMYFPCLDSMITSFLFCGFGRARSRGSRAERLHAGRLPRLRSTLAGLTVLNPFPSKARKRGGCLVVTLTRPVVLAGVEPAPLASVVEPKGKGANQLSRPCICFRADSFPSHGLRLHVSSNAQTWSWQRIKLQFCSQVGKYQSALFPMKFFK